MDAFLSRFDRNVNTQTIQNALTQLSEDIKQYSSLEGFLVMFLSLNEQTLRVINDEGNFFDGLFQYIGGATTITDTIQKIRQAMSNLETKIQNQINTIANDYNIFETEQRNLKASQSQIYLQLQQYMNALNEITEQYNDLKQKYDRLVNDAGEDNSLFIRDIKSESVMCDNDMDLATFEEWEDLDDNIEITQIIIGNSKNCYTKEFLRNSPTRVDDRGLTFRYMGLANGRYYVSEEEFNKINIASKIRLEESGRTSINGRQVNVYAIEIVL